MKTTTIRALVGALTLSLSPLCLAGFVVEDVPAWNGTPGSVHHGWEIFSIAQGGPNANDLGDPVAWLTNLGGPGAIVTGSGNIYGAGTPMDLSITGSGAVREAVLNVATIGESLDLASIRLFDAAMNEHLPDLVTINHEEEIPGFGSVMNISARWLLPATLDGDWEFRFDTGLAGNVSLDAVSIYTRPIPAAGVLPAFGALAFGRRRRRR